LPNHYSHIDLDEYVVMPNHFHGIVWIRGDGRAGLKPAPTADRPRAHPLSEIVRAFKTFSARRINQMRSTPGMPVWQRDYYERVVRNERELNAIREYIQTNPLRWHLDKENPQRIAQGRVSNPPAPSPH
jgi:REP element-mobilizing transposase RayT